MYDASMFGHICMHRLELIRQMRQEQCEALCSFSSTRGIQNAFYYEETMD